MALYQGNVFSRTLNMITQLSVIIPDYPWDIPVDREEQPPKVIYALHGATANASDWVRMTAIEYYARRYNYAVVMPEVQLGFYSNMRYGHDYFTYVAEELPQMIHDTFRLDTSPQNSYIAGLSMGGYGTLKIALSHPENYAGFASFSALTDISGQLAAQREGAGVKMIDPRVFKAVFGEELQPKNSDDPYELVKRVMELPQRPRYLQTCGTEDFLYSDNLKWKEHLDNLGYGHTYLEWKDGHTYPFWDRSIEFAMRFFAGEIVSSSDTSSYGYGLPGAER